MNSEYAILTRSGRFFDAFDPDHREVEIEDIAWSLARKGRFNDHTRVPFSVAAHSLVVSSWCSPDHQLWGLLHDAAEAYTGDLAGPQKRHPSMIGYRRMEDGVRRAVARRFGLPAALPREVKQADLLCLVAESKLLMSRVEEFAEWPRWRRLDTSGFEAMVRALLDLPGPEAVEAAFLDRYYTLAKQRAASRPRAGGDRP